MTTQTEALKMAIATWKWIFTDERTQNHEQTVYWLHQYKMAFANLSELVNEALQSQEQGCSRNMFRQHGQEQEPVAWMDVNDKMPPEEVNFLSFSNVYGYQISMYSNNPVNSTGLPTFDKLKITKWMRIPLYTHPKEWQELSVKEINNLMAILDVDAGIVRAIEQALKEKNT